MSPHSLSDLHWHTYCCACEVSMQVACLRVKALTFNSCNKWCVCKQSRGNSCIAIAVGSQKLVSFLLQFVAWACRCGLREVTVTMMQTTGSEQGLQTQAG